MKGLFVTLRNLNLIKNEEEGDVILATFFVKALILDKFSFGPSPLCGFFVLLTS